MKKTREEILEKHCPSMNNLYLDKQGRAFRDRILLAMKEYAEQTDVNPHVSGAFVCGHPPNKTYLKDGTWHCDYCGGQWQSLANK